MPGAGAATKRSSHLPERSVDRTGSILSSAVRPFIGSTVRFGSTITRLAEGHTSGSTMRVQSLMAPPVGGSGACFGETKGGGGGAGVSFFFSTFGAAGGLGESGSVPALFSAGGFGSHGS